LLQCNQPLFCDRALVEEAKRKAADSKRKAAEQMLAKAIEL
jgi:hypothetical protein